MRTTGLLVGVLLAAACPAPSADGRAMSCEQRYLCADEQADFPDGGGPARFALETCDVDGVVDNCIVFANSVPCDGGVADCTIECTETGDDCTR